MQGYHSENPWLLHVLPSSCTFACLAIRHPKRAASTFGGVVCFPICVKGELLIIAVSPLRLSTCWGEVERWDQQGHKPQCFSKTRHMMNFWGVWPCQLEDTFFLTSWDMESWKLRQVRIPEARLELAFAWLFFAKLFMLQMDWGHDGHDPTWSNSVKPS
jgi:hypothetical protein